MPSLTMGWANSVWPRGGGMIIEAIEEWGGSFYCKQGLG
jgi:hypothetical protein